MFLQFLTIFSIFAISLFGSENNDSITSDVSQPKEEVSSSSIEFAKTLDSKLLEVLAFDFALDQNDPLTLHRQIMEQKVRFEDFEEWIECYLSSDDKYVQEVADKANNLLEAKKEYLLTIEKAIKDGSIKKEEFSPVESNLESNITAYMKARQNLHEHLFSSASS